MREAGKLGNPEVHDPNPLGCLARWPNFITRTLMFGPKQPDK